MIIASSLEPGAQSLQMPNVAKGKVQVRKRVGKLKHCKKHLSEKLLSAKFSEFNHHLRMIKINFWTEYRKKKQQQNSKLFLNSGTLTKSLNSCFLYTASREIPQNKNM